MVQLRRRRHCAAVWSCLVLPLVLIGCAPPTSDSATDGLATASTGVCRAMQALPDVAAAKRLFENGAHEALHLLSADQRLTRGAAAQLLTAMAAVEQGFEQNVGAAVLGPDLNALRLAAASALVMLGVQPSDCPTSGGAAS